MVVKTLINNMMDVSDRIVILCLTYDGVIEYLQGYDTRFKRKYASTPNFEKALDVKTYPVGRVLQCIETLENDSQYIDVRLFNLDKWLRGEM